MNGVLTVTPSFERQLLIGIDEDSSLAVSLGFHNCSVILLDPLQLPCAK